MEPQHPLQKLLDQLTSNTQELQRFIQQHQEMQRVFDELEPGSPESLELAELLQQSDAIIRRWSDGLFRHWDKTMKLASGIWRRHLTQMVQSLDADLAELWKSRPAE